MGFLWSLFAVTVAAIILTSVLVFSAIFRVLALDDPSTVAIGMTAVSSVGTIVLTALTGALAIIVKKLADSRSDAAQKGEVGE